MNGFVLDTHFGPELAWESCSKALIHAFCKGRRDDHGLTNIVTGDLGIALDLLHVGQRSGSIPVK